MRLRQELKDWLKTIVIALGLVLILHYYVFNLSTVDGQSMEPTLKQDEWLFVNKIVYLLEKPKRGEIVILEDPFGVGDNERFLVKRIVGVPGDRIEITGRKLYRNGEQVDEPYTDSPIEDIDYGPEVIQEGHYFVMGDNRHERASLDSRSFHAVPEERIIGRADVILWPIDQIRLL
ncbi:signal peptidase I [Paenibacillus sp. LHD-117]|uniref:signal peptidase I n=1 Tax=Paenibacillus sp. LHD-117 TaxID=3071412 RepID=UPI0027E15FD1|nr:signal peptidase I [Paenibacillus sp. LHD-117]MDQ6423558.1 signal peptidase I [Paenibacillus sp. LHD-117]